MVLVFPVRGVLGTTVTLFPVRLFGATVVLGAVGGLGKSSLLHMSLGQHLEVQFINSCPLLVIVVFCELHTYLGSGWLQMKSKPHCLFIYRICSPLLFLRKYFKLKHWFHPAEHVTVSRFFTQSLKGLSVGHLLQERA